MAAKDSPKHWQPPKELELTINCAARMGRGRGAFSAIARNFSGDVVGATFGGKKCGHPLEIQVYSIFVALQLAERLKNEGKHDGPVTIETHHALARAMVLGTDTDGLEIDGCEIDDDDDDETVPAGFAEAVGAGGDWCTTLTEEEEIAEKLPQDVEDLLEKDKLMAGLTSSKVASQAPAAKDVKDAQVGSSKGPSAQVRADYGTKRSS